MHHFDYRDGVLHAEEVSLAALAETVGTPAYVYSTATLERHGRLFLDALRRAHPRSRAFYALKANGSLGVVRTLARLGFGADVVSEGEIRRAMAAGVEPGAIVFSGVGKTREEIAFAVRAGIYQVNVETPDELDDVARIAAELGSRQDVAIRVNPDVGAGGHAKITTGSDDNKFGVSLADAAALYARGANLPGVRMAGLAVHIGSQITELSALADAFAKLRALALSLRAEGHDVERLDCGGGLGIPYEVPRPFAHGPDLVDAYADLIRRSFGDLEVELGFEPGRLLVGNAGVLLARAVRLNPRPQKTFLVLDAAMNDLVRPAMYEAYHEIWPVAEPAPDAPTAAYDVVGPVCESGDTFATGRRLPRIAPGDLVAFMTAGAYGATMASTYNARRLVPEVIVRGAAFAVARPRQTYEEQLAAERLPDWLAADDAPAAARTPSAA